VELSREQEESLAVNVETIMVPLDDLTQSIVMYGPFRYRIVLRDCQSSKAPQKEEEELEDAYHGSAFGVESMDGLSLTTSIVLTTPGTVG
jgi:hypothetical protein